MRVPDKDGLDKVAAMKHTYHKLSLDCLVILGGNGTHKTANLLREEGLNVVALPKTIDNDLWGTDNDILASRVQWILRQTRSTGSIRRQPLTAVCLSLK